VLRLLPDSQVNVPRFNGLTPAGMSALDLLAPQEQTTELTFAVQWLYTEVVYGSADSHPSQQ